MVHRNEICCSNELLHMNSIMKNGSSIVRFCKSIETRIPMNLTLRRVCGAPPSFDIVVVDRSNITVCPNEGRTEEARLCVRGA